MYVGLMNENIYLGTYICKHISNSKVVFFFTNYYLKSFLNFFKFHCRCQSSTAEFRTGLDNVNIISRRALHAYSETDDPSSGNLKPNRRLSQPKCTDEWKNRIKDSHILRCNLVFQCTTWHLSGTAHPSG